MALWSVPGRASSFATPWFAAASRLIVSRVGGARGLQRCAGTGSPAVGRGGGGRRQSAMREGRRREKATRGCGSSVKEAKEVSVAPWKGVVSLEVRATATTTGCGRSARLAAVMTAGRRVLRSRTLLRRRATHLSYRAEHIPHLHPRLPLIFGPYRAHSLRERRNALSWRRAIRHITRGIRRPGRRSNPWRMVMMRWRRRAERTSTPLFPCSSRRGWDGRVLGRRVPRRPEPVGRPECRRLMSCGGRWACGRCGARVRVGLEVGEELAGASEP